MGLNFNRNQEQYSNFFKKGPIIKEIRTLMAAVDALQCFVGNCGGGAGSGLCKPGGVVFTDAAGNLENNCPKFFWDNANIRLGIGINAPTADLHMFTDAAGVDMKAILNATDGNAYITLKSADANNAFIDYEETSGNRWIVGAYTSNDVFAWADGSAFGNSTRLALTKSSGATPSALRWYEGGASPSNYVSLQTPDSLASNQTYVFPAAYPGTAGETLASDAAGQLSWSDTATQSMIIAVSDETTALTTGVAKVTFRMPYAFTLSAVRASLTTAATGANLIVDINEGGASILSTKLSIDATELTSTTATTPVVISDANLADDAQMTIDIDQIGSTVAGAGLKVYLIGVKA